MDFAQFYQNGGLFMHPIFICSALAAAFIFKGVLAARKQSSAPHVLRLATGLIEGAMLFGLVGTCFGFMEIGAALSSIELELWPSALARATPIALSPLGFAAMLAAPLWCMGAAVRYAIDRKPAVLSEPALGLARRRCTRLAHRPSVGEDGCMRLSFLSPPGLCGVFVVAGFVACTLDTGGLGDEVPPVSEGDVAEKAGETACDWYYRCSCDDLPNNQYTSEDQCADAIAAGLQAAIDEANDVDLTYDGKCAGRALAALEELECTTLTELIFGPDSDVLEPYDCKWFYGEDAVGSSCTELQLSAGDSCVPEARCEAGTCQEIELPIAPGESCDPEMPNCSGDALCLDIEGGGQWACTELPEEGQTCLGQQDLCDDGLTCDQVDKLCEVAPGAGKQCASGSSACAEGFYCHDSGTCAALPPAGEPCAASLPQCELGAMCDAGTCVAEDALTCNLGPNVFRLVLP